MSSLIIFLPLIAIMYFLMIRPQQRKMRDHRQLLASVEVGDDIVTSAGIYGRVSELDGETLFLQVSDNVELKITKESIAGLISYDETEDELVDDE
jgi:preprotein translocase subunit YajC